MSGCRGTARSVWGEERLASGGDLFGGQTKAPWIAQIDAAACRATRTMGTRTTGDEQKDRVRKMGRPDCGLQARTIGETPILTGRTRAD